MIFQIKNKKKIEKRKSKKTMLIAIEGIDGSGKTTIAYFLKETLEKCGYNVVLFKEPGDSPWGLFVKEIKKITRLKPELELKLFILDRKYNVKKNILPELKKGKLVILDRYYYSTIAYQGACGLNADLIKKINEKFAPKPDLVIILDVQPEKAIERIKKKRKVDKFEDLKYLRRVREIFLSIKDENIVVVDANKDVNSVKQDVKNIIFAKLKATCKRI